MLRQEQARGKFLKGTNPLSPIDRVVSPLGNTQVLNSAEYNLGPKVIQRESLDRISKGSGYNSRQTQLHFLTNQQTMRDLQASHDYQESDEKAQPLSAKKAVTAVAFG